ncbi:hypothetical protein NDU88_003603 [Pleurodeles waltl]|uniref:Uncharacterized protein n=1 Tax=Pleurodeles waltl TaxID=8319 RepID=A0AAV7UDA3_PLEWA|nr:hypothetical protein NDU88_003603 [Pleurodeles waltl]
MWQFSCAPTGDNALPCGLGSSAEWVSQSPIIMSLSYLEGRRGSIHCLHVSQSVSLGSTRPRRLVRVGIAPVSRHTSLRQGPQRTGFCLSRSSSFLNYSGSSAMPLTFSSSRAQTRPLSGAHERLPTQTFLLAPSPVPPGALLPLPLTCADNRRCLHHSGQYTSHRRSWLSAREDSRHFGQLRSVA